MNNRQPFIIYIIAIIAAMGGLLFGFDTGVISGAIPFFQQDFKIDDGMVEIITSAGLVGAILGAAFSGKLTDRIGRRKIILIAAVIFIVGALGSGIAPAVWTLVIARLVLGVAIGISSYSVPLYLAEISPTKIRGTLVSLFQLMITIGILSSYLSDLYFADESDITCWRSMLYVCAIPAVILFVGIIFMPETPRWLFSKGRSEESLKILKRIEGEHNASISFGQMQEELQKSLETEKTGWKELWKPWLRIPIIIALGVMFFQQFVGINTVIYYSPKIFLMAGFDGAVSAIWASVGIGVVTVIATLVSVFFVDKLGRRKLYFLGMSGMLVSLFLLGLCFAFHTQLSADYQWTYIACMFVYVAFFSISIGPLGWVILSEIFPQKVRALGTSLGSLANWFFNTAVAFSFFKIVKLLTVSGTEITLNSENMGNPMGAFWFYGGIAFVAILWGYHYIPETKGISLENIEDFWRKGGKPRELGKNNKKLTIYDLRFTIDD
jgi:sugar porter (SP) family MFS transporter